MPIHKGVNRKLSRAHVAKLAIKEENARKRKV